MTIRYQRTPGDIAIAEMREFATFPSRTQRYILRSLDVGLMRDDAIALWSRDGVEEAGIRVQERVYTRLPVVRDAIPDDSGLDSVGPFMGALVAMSAFDLGQDRLPSFSAYRFLYERLLGAAARPWLPGAFCAAAALPHLHPDKRKTLLQSIGEVAATAPGWSAREPAFYPAWVDKIDTDTPAH
ncbi:MAG: hypothetical protein ACKOUM_07255 [Sphingopyxis sp.]